MREFLDWTPALFRPWDSFPVGEFAFQFLSVFLDEFRNSHHDYPSSFEPTGRKSAHFLFEEECLSTF